MHMSQREPQTAARDAAELAALVMGGTALVGIIGAVNTIGGFVDNVLTDNSPSRSEPAPVEAPPAIPMIGHPNVTG